MHLFSVKMKEPGARIYSGPLHGANVDNGFDKFDKKGAVKKVRDKKKEEAQK